MVRLIPSHVFIKDPVDAWGKEETIGLAELAARGKCPISTDRRGNVIWHDDFEESFAWEDISGVGASAARSTDRPYMGAFSLKLLPSANVASAKMLIGQPPMTTSIGIECAFTLDSSITDFTMTLAVYDGTNRYQGKLYYYDGFLWYIDDAGGFTKVTATPISLYYGTHYHAKMVIDMNTGKYVRFVFADTEYDLTESVFATASAISPHLDIRCSANGTGGISYVDDVILTENEI